MKITDKAKALLKEALASNKCDALQALQEKSCCGTYLVFNLTKLDANEKPVIINDIPVIMDSDAQERAEKVTIDVENGELVARDDAASSCGC
ncbi:MAG: hypothetical protein WCS90_02400 [Bacilli bacterium]|jgi:Fe-S cluster assembly iron-binding protein IscA